MPGHAKGRDRRGEHGHQCQHPANPQPEIIIFMQKLAAQHSAASALARSQHGRPLMAATRLRQGGWGWQAGRSSGMGRARVGDSRRASHLCPQPARAVAESSFPFRYPPAPVVFGLAPPEEQGHGGRSGVLRAPRICAGIAVRMLGAGKAGAGGVMRRSAHLVSGPRVPDHQGGLIFLPLACGFKNSPTGSP